MPRHGRWFLPALMLVSASLLASEPTPSHATGDVAGSDRSRPRIEGHLIMMNGPNWAAEDVYDADPTTLSEAARNNVAGVMVKYFWRDLEPAESTPEKRVYDLSMIEHALAYLEREGLELKLVAQVMDRSFFHGGNRNQRANPRWVEAAGLDIEYRKGGGGHVSKRWDPRVADALADVHDAINQRFEDRPNFAGTATEETALGLSPDQAAKHGYSPEAYRDALIRLGRSVASRSPTTRLYFYMNYLPGGQQMLADVAAAIAIAPYQVAIGGPDILPNDPALLRHVYPLYDTLPDGTYRVSAAQYNSYRHRKPGGDYYTMMEICRFGRDELGLDAIVWNRPPQPNPAGSRDVEDALAVIAGADETLCD